MSMVIEARSVAEQWFTVRSLSPLVAAEVTGLDLREPLDPATRQAVYDAFVRYQVLAFRDQSLTRPEQIAFTLPLGFPSAFRFDTTCSSGMSPPRLLAT